MNYLLVSTSGWRKRKKNSCICNCWKAVWCISHFIYPENSIIKIINNECRLYAKRNRQIWILVLFLPLIVLLVTGLLFGSMVFVVWCVAFVSILYVVKFAFFLLKIFLEKVVCRRNDTK